MNKTIRHSLLVVIFFVLYVSSSSAQDEILYRRHLINSGINGLFYGLAFDDIAGIDGAPAAGVAVISTGTSILIPVLSNSAKTITPNSMILSNHGKLIGWVHGFALATLIGGENAWNETNKNLTLSMGIASSIGLGILGNSLGKSMSWTDGQVALYRHYGWVMPLTGISIAASFSDSPRLYGASVITFGAVGYLLADRVYHYYPYTRGDVRATQVLTVFNGGLGFGILADKEDRGSSSQADILFPAIGVITGTVIGHLWTKDANLSPKQGLQTAYAATGGSILGLGIALLTNSQKITPYYVIPYITGMGTYAFILERMKKINKTEGFLQEDKKTNWQFAFMPQNLYLNSRISNGGLLKNGRIIGMQPFFAASLKF